jgi:hypothetical protein
MKKSKNIDGCQKQGAVMDLATRVMTKSGVCHVCGFTALTWNFFMTACSLSDQGRFDRFVEKLL